MPVSSLLLHAQSKEWHLSSCLELRRETNNKNKTQAIQCIVVFIQQEAVNRFSGLNKGESKGQNSRTRLMQLKNGNTLILVFLLIAVNALMLTALYQSSLLFFYYSFFIHHLVHTGTEDYHFIVYLILHCLEVICKLYAMTADKLNLID